MSRERSETGTVKNWLRGQRAKATDLANLPSRVTSQRRSGLYVPPSGRETIRDVLRKQIGSRRVQREAGIIMLRRQRAISRRRKFCGMSWAIGAPVRDAGTGDKIYERRSRVVRVETFGKHADDPHHSSASKPSLRGRTEARRDRKRRAQAQRKAAARAGRPNR